jgi:hypothetical protein
MEAKVVQLPNVVKEFKDNVKAEVEKQKKSMADLARENGVDLMDPEQRAYLQKNFEMIYGKDSKTRTRKQWAKLLKTYGWANVIQQEKMTKTAIKKLISKLPK